MRREVRSPDIRKLPQKTGEEKQEDKEEVLYLVGENENPQLNDHVVRPLASMCPPRFTATTSGRAETYGLGNRKRPAGVVPISISSRNSLLESRSAVPQELREGHDVAFIRGSRRTSDARSGDASASSTYQKDDHRTRETRGNATLDEQDRGNAEEPSSALLLLHQTPDKPRKSSHTRDKEKLFDDEYFSTTPATSTTTRTEQGAQLRASLPSERLFLASTEREVVSEQTAHLTPERPRVDGGADDPFSLFPSSTEQRTTPHLHHQREQLLTETRKIETSDA
ncbi:unnamed protein product [Amoebophrya sp. A25]|nr:unnamed protein product [Amoebophrya sp. A25]|eukprot:GSA25T00010964001.1